MDRYGKSPGAALDKSEGFVASNSDLVEFATEINIAYRDQPPRISCKACTAERHGRSFYLADTEYWLCSVCSHLNGGHEDTPAFAEKLYGRNLSSAMYAQNYLTFDELRINEVYRPKAKFLYDALVDEGRRPSELPTKVLDVGASSGLFVHALGLEGFFATGIETNVRMVIDRPDELSNADVRVVRPDQVLDEIAQSDTQVLSFIHVLEHISDLEATMDAVRRSNAQYLFLAVPLYSLSTLLQRLFPSVYPRQLSLGHTHLFTEKSVNLFLSRHGFEPRSYWWFGADFVDFFRSGLVKGLQDEPGYDDFGVEWRSLVGPHIEDWQQILDANRVCSEVHILARRSRGSRRTRSV